MTRLPDPHLLTKDELRARLHELTSQEEEVSATRRDLHVEINALRRELANRLSEEGVHVIAGDEVARAQPPS